MRDTRPHSHECGYEFIALLWLRGNGGDRCVTIQIVAKAPVANMAIKNNSNNTSAPTTLAGRSGGTKVFGTGGGFGFSSFGAASVVITMSFAGVCAACAAALGASSGGAVDGGAAGGASGATTDGSVAPVIGIGTTNNCAHF
jgi:hypothetical protein